MRDSVMNVDAPVLTMAPGAPPPVAIAYPPTVANPAKSEIYTVALTDVGAVVASVTAHAASAAAAAA